MSTDGDPTSSLYSPSDVDGDAVSDYIVGVPAASVAGLSGAGAVDVHYGSSGTQRFGDALFPGSGGPTAGAGFGSSIALTNLSGATSQNVDVCADLVIGAPGAGRGRGAIVIAQGSNAGVSATGSLVLAGPVAGARFGSVVVAYRDDIWVGAPDQPVDGAAQAGAVYHYRWANGSLTLLQTLTESTPGVPGLAEKDDHFGSVLAVGAGDELVIGEPDEDIGSHAVDAGTATVVFTSPTSGLLTRATTVSQDTAGIPGTAEAGDRFGAAVSVGLLGDDYAVAVGVPGEALGRLTGAGTVDVFTPAASGGGLTDTAAHSQDTAGVPGNDETADHLGQQVAIVAGELCAGVPGEDLGTVRDAGRVLCTASVDGRGRPAAPWLSIQQGGSGATSLGGSPTAGAAVGAAVSRIAADREGDTFFYGERPVIGAPGATVSGQAAAGQVFGPPPIIDRAGPVAGERYGVPATAVSNGPELRD